MAGKINKQLLTTAICIIVCGLIGVGIGVLVGNVNVSVGIGVVAGFCLGAVLRFIRK